MNLLPLKKVAAKTLSHPMIGRLITAWKGDEISVRGCVINTHNEQVSPSLIARLYWGFYESAEMRFVTQYLRRDLDVIELGSGIGVVSSLIAKLQTRDRRLLCVEANPFLADAIVKNVRKNAPWKQFEVINQAIDYAGCEYSAFFLDNLTNSKIEPGSSPGSLKVPTATLDALWRSSGYNDYALVSDIEGAEAGYIFQDATALVPCKQIIAELHETIFAGHRYSIDHLREQLEKTHGFRVKASHGPVFVLEKS